MKRLSLVAIFGLILIFSSTAKAAQSTSPSYQVNEVQFGPGSQLNASSPNYRAQQSLGSTAVGGAKSTNFATEAGFLTPSTPYLEMIVTPATLDLGTLNSLTAATGTATFSVRAYVDSGYTVLTVNDPPQSESGAILKGMSTATASSPGTEQFGINLVQNLTTCPTPAPANFGADPVLVPSSTFANGQAATGYNTCGKFKYVKGDVIAGSNGKGWGQTNYTISYLANINAASRAGKYTVVQDLVVVATY